MKLRLPDDFTRIKEQARWVRSQSLKQKMDDFVGLTMIVESGTCNDPHAQSRQRSWIDREKDAILNTLRKISAAHHEAARA